MHRCLRSATKRLTSGPNFFTKPAMPWRTANLAMFSGILNCSWCSSTVSQAGWLLPLGSGMVRERHML